MEFSNNGGVNIRSYERCASAEGTFVFAAIYILSSAKLFSTMEKELKRRKPNWSESELMALAEAVAPHFRVLKGKFSAFITSERKNQLWQDIANQVNAVAMVNRTTEEMKKKWADMQSLTKKKEAERRRSMKQTGGGPAPNFMFKNWENLVLQSLSDVAIEGISGGVDTAECESRPSPVVPAGIIIHEVPASENSELSESASTPCARMTSINNSTYKDMNFESESSQSQERPRKQTRVQRKENEVPVHISQLLSMEEEKISKLETYRSRKIKILEEMLELQRRSTIAVESISNSMHQSGNSQPLSLSLSPVIKFS